MKTPAFIAEISGNHLGKLARAEALVDAAAAAGADGVKFQTFEPAQLVGSPRIVLEDGPWKGRKLVDLYKEAWTPKKWLTALFPRARAHGMVAFSSPFSPDDVDALEALDCPIYKIASFEITDLDLVRYAAQTKKPMVISTGMATLVEIDDAVDAALANGAEEVTILKCTSGYPAPLEEANVATIRDLLSYFGGDGRIAVGLSDHTTGNAAAAAAIALGAVMIEKHLTFSRAEGGPDAGFSVEPLEFRALVELGRGVSDALGGVHYGPTDSELPQLKLRRALWVVEDVAEGAAFTRENLRSCRPSCGIKLWPIGDFLGCKARQAVRAGTLFLPSMAV